MDKILYVEALKVDLYVAATIGAMLDDGEIDLAIAERVWLALIEGQRFRANGR